MSNTEWLNNSSIEIFICETSLPRKRHFYRSAVRPNSIQLLIKKKKKEKVPTNWMTKGNKVRSYERIHSPNLCCIKIKVLRNGILCTCYTVVFVCLFVLILLFPAEDRTLSGTRFLVSFESVFSELEQVR